MGEENTDKQIVFPTRYPRPLSDMILIIHVVCCHVQENCMILEENKNLTNTSHLKTYHFVKDKDMMFSSSNLNIYRHCQSHRYTIFKKKN